MTETLRRILLYLLVFVVFQIPMLHRWVLFDVAFPFQYIGLILLLPHTLPKYTILWIAFGTGLLIDIFSNTPGIHAASSLMIAFIRLNWLLLIDDSNPDEMDLNLTDLGFLKFSFYTLPLIFIHHFLIFLLENEGFRWPILLLNKIFWSSLFSFFIILLASLYVAPKKRRL